MPVRRINWGQAAGEALLILVGILLALAADAWWEERTERRQEQEYLAALLIELDQMKEHVGAAMRDADQVVEAGRVLLEITPDWPSAVSTDSLSSLIAGLSSEVLWAPPTTVYQDLVNTGAVGLIESDEVRLGLNELMEIVSWVDSRQLRHNEFFWTEMEPYFRTHIPILAVFGWDALAVDQDDWIPGDFLGAEEFRNLVAGKSLTALDVRDGGEDLTAFIDELTRTISTAAGGN
ncbi:MAG: hypothetical protein HKN71_11205 [Gemmatimonadetes bacterium]|nr:hypothetical protein [Gemmatimonadota bacterium]